MGYDPTGHFSWDKVFKTATVVTLVAIGVLVIISSGGAAAPPLLAAASAIAGTTVTAATATAVATGVAITGVAAMGVSATASLSQANRNNGYSGGSTYNKGGNRIDYEYYGNGNGNAHYHGNKGKIVLWKLEKGIETVYTVSKAVNEIISSPQIQRAISKAKEIVLSLAGNK